MSTVRPEPVRAVVTIQLIATVSLVGLGDEDDPAREVIQLWTDEGYRLVTFDPEVGVNEYALTYQKLRELVVP